MDTLRKAAGVLWMILGPAAIYFLISEASIANTKAVQKISAATTDALRETASLAKTNTNLQWGIIITIFVPIMIGLVIFGYYAVKGEYAEERQIVAE